MPATAHAAIGRTLAGGYLAHGANVTEFEQHLARYLAAEHLVAMSDGSAALTLALYQCGVGPGDEVIVSPLACLATTMPIANLRARPAWCDVDPATGMPTAETVAPVISGRSRAILLYHWSGDVGPAEQLRELARRRGLRLIVDASEAFGAESNGRRLATGHADFTVYSFSAVRQITAGEGAALVIDAQADWEQSRWLRRYGIHGPSFRLPGGDLNPDSDIPVAGFNFALNNIAATLGVEQMPHADRIVARYRDNGRYFDQALSGVAGARLLERRADAVSGFWTYSFRAERREALLQKLHAEGIGCQRLHLRNDAYSCFAASRSGAPLPGVERFDRENLSIPCGWWVTDEDRERVARCIRAGW